MTIIDWRSDFSFMLYHHLLADTRWRGWVVACSTLIVSAESQCTWGTLIGFSFRAEETSHFFSHQGGACRHTDMHPSGGWDTTWAVWSKKLTDQPVPRRCLSDTALEIDHSDHTGRIVRKLIPSVQRRNQTSAPFSELKVRRVSSSRSQECEDGLLQDFGEIPEQHLLCQTNMCITVILPLRKISVNCYRLRFALILEEKHCWCKNRRI